MFTISFGFNTKKLEDLIMATKAELMEKIGELYATVSEEAVQVRSAVKELEGVVSGLTEKIATLELEADLSPEIEALEKVRTDIEAIYSPAVATLVEPVDA